MPQESISLGAKLVLSSSGLQELIAALVADDYQVFGPTLENQAIVYAPVTGVQDLPRGWTDRQAPGRYQLERRDDDALFGYVVGPHAWKRFLNPPTERLWRARRTADGFTVDDPEAPAGKLAFIGVRGCELHAIAIQDRVLLDGPYPNTGYRQRRADNFIIAVNCGEAGGTCFCVSMNTGPKVEAGFDLSLTEVLDDRTPWYLIEVGSAAGAAILAKVSVTPADPARITQADAVVAHAAAHMGRHLDTAGLKETLQANPDHRQWDDVAARCLSCANCTMVCPTCFCTTVEDVTDLSGQTAERVRRWDSCFTSDFSYIHGGSVRVEPRSRYRQWMTHKLANWIDQFGTSGCVGCGRCITWCPVGIDITAEATAIQATPKGIKEPDHGGT